MKSDGAHGAHDDRPHFMLEPPSAFTKSPLGVTFPYTGKFSYPGANIFPLAIDAYSSQRLDWNSYEKLNTVVVGPITRHESETVESLHAFVDGGCAEVPLAYLLVNARLLTPGHVLRMLRASEAVPAIAATKHALDMMLGSWVVNTFTGAALLPGRPLDIIGGGHDATVDSDPTTEALFVAALSQYQSYRYGSNPVTLAQLRASMREVLFPGELPAAVLARLAPSNDLWHFAEYTAGTLRQVFAGVLHGKRVLGHSQAPRAQLGYHTEDDWA